MAVGFALVVTVYRRRHQIDSPPGQPRPNVPQYSKE
jgi:hypothetical protein